MKRLYSLKGRKVFQAVFRNGRRISGSGVVLIVLRDGRNMKEDSAEYGNRRKNNRNSKIAITVRKKYGNAVTRNRIKRIVRAACRDLMPTLKEGYHIIIQPKDSFKDLQFIEIRNDIKRVLSKSGIIA